MDKWCKILFFTLVSSSKMITQGTENVVPTDNAVAPFKLVVHSAL